MIPIAAIVAPAVSLPTGGALSDDTTLATFTVDGSAVGDDQVVNVNAGTGSVAVAATPTVPGTRTINGSSAANPVTVGSLVTGDNVITVHVVAQDGVTTEDHIVTIHVLTAGVAEVTTVDPIDNVAGALHNKHFTINRAGAQVAVVIDCGGKKETTTIDFTGLSGTNFSTDGAGKSINFSGESGLCRVWFNTGNETDPGGGGVSFEADIDITDDASAIVATVSSIVGSQIDFSVNGAVITLTAKTAGARTDAADVDTGALITVTQQGRDAITPIGGMTNIAVSIPDSRLADNIVDDIIAATNGQGWTVTKPSSGRARFVDSVAGARTDAADVDTGFTVAVATQGVDPS